MALPIWPAGVPLTMLEDVWQMSLPDNAIVETEMEDGPSRIRPRAIENWVDIPVKLILTAAEHTTFWTFYYTTTARGQSSFTATVRRPSGTSAAKTCRFTKSTPVTSAQLPYYIVTFPMRVRDYYA